MYANSENECPGITVISDTYISRFEGRHVGTHVPQHRHV